MEFVFPARPWGQRFPRECARAARTSLTPSAPDRTPGRGRWRGFLGAHPGVPGSWEGRRAPATPAQVSSQVTPEARRGQAAPPLGHRGLVALGQGPATSELAAVTARASDRVSNPVQRSAFATDPPTPTARPARALWALGLLLWGHCPVSRLPASSPASLPLGPLQRGLAPSCHSPWSCEPPDGQSSLCISATLTVSGPVVTPVDSVLPLSALTGAANTSSSSF